MSRRFRYDAIAFIAIDICHIAIAIIARFRYFMLIIFVDYAATIFSDFITIATFAFIDASPLRCYFRQPYASHFRH